MQSTISLPYRPIVQLRRTPFDFVVIFTALLLLLLLIVTASWHFWYSQRIYPGVQIAGVAVGGMTRASARQALDQQLPKLAPAPISLYAEADRWLLPTDQLVVQTDLFTAVNQAYLVGRQGEFGTRLIQQWATALGGALITPPLRVDETGIRAAVQAIASQAARPPQPSSQIGNVQLAAQPGREVNVEATVQAIIAALQNGDLGHALDVPLAVRPLAPPAAAASTTAPAVAASTLPPALVLHDDQSGLEFALDPATVAKLVLARAPLQIDQAGLQTLLNNWAAQIALPARDARLRFNSDTGGVTVVQASQAGRKLDIEATQAAVQAALSTNEPIAKLAVVTVPPAVDMNKVAEMGIRELVASATTYFKGSSAARVHNIAVGAEKIDGITIPPDGVFSFNKVVENVTSANDFEDSLVIVGDTTAVGAGGGICQVSTTVFRAAYEGGFPIVERYNHGYVVSWYGEPGLDATIFTPSVDFRFRNDTNAYLLVESAVDAANGTITVNLWGTRPDRQVTVNKPVQSEVKQPEPPAYKVDNSLAKDQKEQVEWEHDGMTVTVERTIVENGTTRTDTLVSKYQPWRAVYLVGPGTEIPATPTPESSGVMTATNTVSETGQTGSTP